jgi:hypothetical protein
MSSNHDHPKKAGGKPASLSDPQAMGGIIALGGFDFQRDYALILLLQSLKDPHFSALLIEGAEDVEVHSGQCVAIQVKNHPVTTSKAKEIIDHFCELDTNSPKTWSSFVIACTGLDSNLSAIHRQLKRYRSTGSFYDEKNGILVNTGAELKERIDEAELPIEFVMERVSFQPDLAMYQEDELVQAWATHVLHDIYPEIDYAGIETIYLRLADMLKKFTGKEIARHQIQAIIDAELDKHPEKVVGSDQDIDDLLKLFTQHAAFIEVDYTGGDPTAMFAAIRRTFSDMGAKPRFMLGKDDVAKGFRGIRQQLYLLEKDTWEKYPEVANLANSEEIKELKPPDRKKKVRSILGEKMSDDASRFLRERALQIRDSVEELVADLGKKIKTS